MSTAAALPRVEGQHQNHALAAARRARALELVTQGMTYQQVADELGYASRGTVHRIVNRALSRETSEAVKELRELEVARPDALQAALWGRAMDGDVAAARTAMRIVIARLPALGLHRMLLATDRLGTPHATASSCAKKVELPDVFGAARSFSSSVFARSG